MRHEGTDTRRAWRRAEGQSGNNPLSPALSPLRRATGQNLRFLRIFAAKVLCGGRTGSGGTTPYPALSPPGRAKRYWGISHCNPPASRISGKIPEPSFCGKIQSQGNGCQGNGNKRFQNHSPDNHSLDISPACSSRPPTSSLWLQLAALGHPRANASSSCDRLGKGRERQERHFCKTNPNSESRKWLIMRYLCEFSGFQHPLKRTHFRSRWPVKWTKMASYSSPCRRCAPISSRRLGTIPESEVNQG